jgi:imidazole glycerol-phosphate synthase subunit HisH
MAAGLTAVVDYGLCNIDSMSRALEECGARQVVRTRDPRELARADRIVLPGVGNYTAAMRNLAEFGLIDVIREASVTHNTPFLGACLGMQLMATRGEEGASSEHPTPGLALIEGDVVRLVASGATERVPHIGWNEVEVKPGSVLMAGAPSPCDFYFVHSFHLRLTRGNDEAGRTHYCGGFTAAFEATDRPIFGTQFHPEKSQKNGFRVLRNFLTI